MKEVKPTHITLKPLAGSDVQTVASKAYSLVLQAVSWWEPVLS